MTSHMQILKIYRRYYSVLMAEIDNGYEVEKLRRARTADYVQPRAAILVALSNKYRPYHISKALNIHHTTILYHRRKHEGNVLSWNGYEPIYKLAEEVMDKSFIDGQFAL